MKTRILNKLTLNKLLHAEDFVFVIGNLYIHKIILTK